MCNRKGEKMTDIAVVGVGRLGLCLSLVLARAGFKVVGVDRNETYVKELNDKTFKTPEPFVEDFLRWDRNTKYTTELRDALTADVVFLVVPTPSLPDGSYDHSYLEDVATDLRLFGEVEDKHLVVNATTMPGYCDTLAEKMEPFGWTVSYNPEFIAQGNIIKDQMNPDMILIGEGSESAGSKIAAVYERLNQNSNPEIHRMSRISAEITKLSLNCFLTTKITFANMVGDVCTSAGADATAVLGAIGSDSRAGPKYLNYGFGYGGPCFPRDNRALGKYAESVGIDALISHATDEYNKLHLEYMLKEVRESDARSSGVYMDYVSYKKGTDIIEESQELEYVLQLVREGFNVTVKDRKEVIEKVRSQHPELSKKITFIEER